eukprot:192801_1
MIASVEPRYFIKPISAFNHENVLYIQTVITLLIFFCCYYQCRINKNLSYVDHFRGIIPIIYSITTNIHYYYHKHSFNIRLLLIGLFTIIWGIRMTYYINIKLTKRGKFQQDSRWDVVFAFINQPQRPYIWQLFVFFVANIYQIFSWFIMVNMPFYMIYNSTNINASLSFIDYGLSVLYLFFLIIECIADYQMTEFRKIKFKKMFDGHSIMYTHEDITIERGKGDEFAFNGWRYDFLSTGLRKYCCHPNYFSEMCLWAIVYLFGIIHYDNGLFDIISIMGLIGYLSLCFKLYKLSIVTEGILAYSYGSYYRYHATINRFIPWIPKQIILDQSVVGKNKVNNKIEEEYLSDKCSQWSGDNIWIG